MDFINLHNHNRIVFIRHGKVNLPYPSHDEMPFDVLAQLSNQKLDPLSDQEYFLMHKSHFKKLFKDYNFRQILISSSQRCTSLFSYIENLINVDDAKKKETPYLREILFDLELLFSDRVVDMPALKLEIIKRLFNNEPGVEPLSQVLERLQKFVNMISDLGDTLVVTHGYLMMVIAGLYISNGKVTRDVLSRIPRFQYFDGFSIDSNGQIEWIASYPNRHY